jgi:hypothetical protein
MPTVDGGKTLVDSKAVAERKSTDCKVSSKSVEEAVVKSIEAEESKVSLAQKKDENENDKTNYMKNFIATHKDDIKMIFNFHDGE